MPVRLAGSYPDHGLLRVCQRCSNTVSPAGGVQMSPARWVCSACWKTRVLAQVNTKPKAARS